jgi:flagellar biosynthesis protein FliP
MSIAMKLYGQSFDLSKKHNVNQFELIQKLAEPFHPYITTNTQGEHIYTFEDKSQFILTNNQTVQVKLF